MFPDTNGSLASILIVDDIPSNIHVLRSAVHDMAALHFAMDGPNALKIVREHRPDVVLLDIEMPDMDGFAVCEAIKSDPQLRDTTVIFVTATERETNELQALHYGGVDFLHKPLNIPVARARIQAHLNLQLRTRELAQARRNLADVVSNLPAFIAHWDADLGNCYCNDIEGTWFDVPAANMQGRHLRDIIGEAAFESMDEYLHVALLGHNSSFEIAFKRNSLHRRSPFLYGQVALVARQSESGSDGFLMLITDITERKLAEMALNDEKERIRITLNSIGDAVIATDTNGRINFVNPIAETMTGWHASEAEGMPIEEVMPLNDGSMGYRLQNPVRLALKEERVVGMAMNCVLRRRDGRDFEVEDSAAPIRDHTGKVTGAIIVFHDVSEAHAMAIKMTHLANHDALTSLPNRMLLQDRTEQALQHAQRNGEKVAMVLLDIDHFKTINDSIGHSTGDDLLKQIAQRLKHTIRSNDTVSRQGGDEFIVLLPSLEDIEQAGQFAARLLRVVSEPYWVGAHRFDLSVSIGISLYPDDCMDMESLYRHADAAMYRAKQEGRNRFQFFSTEIEDTLRSKHLMERRMRDALDRGDFEVFYQPKVDASIFQIVGVEALVRWRDSDGRLISPAEFIPLAEETGLIIPLGNFVMQQACKDGKRWHDEGIKCRIAINISAVQFNETSFVATVQSILAATEVETTLVELEITEGTLAKDVEQTSATISQLKKFGVKIALDDFGTGYSSLSYLKHFPIDVLKIDQSFVRDMMVDPSDAAIIYAIIGMATGLNLRLVAEGVETREQASTLLQQGCKIMQGYLYSRPLPYEQVSLLLKNGLPAELRL